MIHDVLKPEYTPTPPKTEIRACSLGTPVNLKPKGFRQGVLEAAFPKRS